MLSSTDPVSGLSKRLLIVDDDDAYREATAKLFRTAGWEVRAAQGFHAALTFLENGEPLPVMIVDIVMPHGVNGFALGRMARMRHPHIKLAYITGHDIGDAKREANGNIFQKPIEFEILLAEAERLYREAVTNRNG